MESLLYVAGLQHGAAILKHLGHKEQADFYLERAQAVQVSIRKYCTGEDAMLQDGPGIEQYSQQKSGKDIALSAGLCPVFCGNGILPVPGITESRFI